MDMIVENGKKEIKRSSKRNKYDFISHDFDMYFRDVMEHISLGQRVMIPIKLLNKFFIRGVFHVERLSFSEKCFILSTVFDRRVYVLVGGDSNSDKDVFSVDLLNKADAVAKRKKGAMESLVKEMQDNNMFCVGDMELMNSVALLNMSSVSKLYHLLMPLVKRKVMVDDKMKPFNELLSGVIKFLLWYDGNKKRFKSEYDMNIAEWYALLFYWNGEKDGFSFYDDSYLLTSNSNEKSRRIALNRLVRDGYLFTRGANKNRVYRLSPKGMHTLNNIFEKIIFNQ